MSIIHEALKKTQKNLAQHHHDKLHHDNAELKHSRLTNKKKAKDKAARVATDKIHWLNVLRLTLLFVLISLALGLVYKLVSYKMPLSSVRVSKAQVIVPKQPAYPTLSGVMIMDGKELAVFNNKMLGKGDTVSGDKIISIEPDRVIVSHLGTLHTLFVK